MLLGLSGDFALCLSSSFADLLSWELKENMSNILNEYISMSEDSTLDSAYGIGYRCSVDLIDGTHLPCVMLRRPKPTVDLALRRFEDERKGRSIFREKTGGYEKIVQTFVASGNRLNSYDISNVTDSRFAIPKTLLKQIEGETIMSWTGWVFEMSDGKLFSYGSTFLFEFFQLPNQYSFSDVVKVHNHSFLDDSGNIKLIRENMDDMLKYRDFKNSITLYRERPYFTCFVEEK